MVLGGGGTQKEASGLHHLGGDTACKVSVLIYRLFVNYT